MKKQKLRDGSHIVRYTKVRMSGTVGKSDFYSVFAEALTSNDETVIVSSGVAGSIAREASEEFPETEFHLLDGRYKFPFWYVDSESLTLLAIDESGEIWILSSEGKHKEGRYCPELDSETVEVKKPTKTSLMQDKNMKALRLCSTAEFLLVEAECTIDQKKHILVIEWAEKYKPLGEKMQKIIEEIYDPISD